MLDELKKGLETLTDQYSLKAFMFQALKVLDSLNGQWNLLSAPEFFCGVHISDDLTGNNRDLSGVVSFSNDISELGVVRKAFSQYRLCDSQSKKRTFRLPGVVIANSEWIELARRINEVKSLIETAMLKTDILDNSRERGLFVSTHFGSDISLKQLYRRIFVFDQRLSSVSFTWAKNVPQSNNVSREFVLKLLQDEIDSAQRAGRDGFVDKVSSELDLIRRKPEGTEFKIYRKINPHPRANIVPFVGKPFMRPANVPFLLDSSVNSKYDVVIQSLTDDADDRKPRSDNTMGGYEEVIERLCLWATRL